MKTKFYVTSGSSVTVTEIITTYKQIYTTVLIYTDYSNCSRETGFKWDISYYSDKASTMHDSNTLIKSLPNKRQVTGIFSVKSTNNKSRVIVWTVNIIN